MSLKYYNATDKIRQPNPKASYYADYAAMMDFGFDNAPNVVYDEVEYEYFLGFESDDTTNRWRVFARVLVDREKKECKFLDYKTPDGVRMENPIKPTSFA